MPTYQYACTECDHKFEQVQSFSEDSLTECPKCTGRLRKLYNAVGIVFKGPGFYRTDNRSSNSSSSSTSSSSASSDSGSSKSESSKAESSKSGSAKSDSGSSSTKQAAAS